MPDPTTPKPSEGVAEHGTPLMRQYGAIKKEHPNALLFFRLGDFYELFFDDAVVAARELQITLTSRNKEKGIAIPMCGVPYHAAEQYIARLIRKGFKVAICEQMEDPKLAKKIVRREVTRVVTPGTAADLAIASEENNFLAAVARMGGAVGFAALDLSTGEFRATEFQGADAERRIAEELQQLRPREVLFGSSLPLFARSASPALNDAGGAAWANTPLDDWVFAPDYAIPLVENHFGVLSLEGFGLAGRAAAASAAGAILHYVRSTQRGTLEHIDRIGYYERQNCLVLDAVTVRNLELVEPLFAGGDAGVTLFRAIDATLTPMGKRLLRAWMLRPAIDAGEITLRLDAVEAQARDLIGREELRRALDGILDLERLLSRVTLEAANPRDVLALAASLGKIPAVRTALERFVNAAPAAGNGHPERSAEDAESGDPGSNPDPSKARLATLHSLIDDLADLRARIDATIVDEPPLTFADGGVIRDGIDAALDELRGLSRNSKQYVAGIEERERKRTGIGSLKVKFNSVFGYYLEITKPNLHLAPSDYERKQTLVNAERFTTPELKEYESKILDAQEKILDIERRIFAELRGVIAGEARRIRQTALALAETDVLASFAHIAATRNYCRPQIVVGRRSSVVGPPSTTARAEEGVGSPSSMAGSDRAPTPIMPADDQRPATDDVLEILEGRHPVVEQQEIRGGERFVPNDLFLNSTTNRIVVLTGPNMGGKSTYLRQTALITIMAQMGSFVPARSARMSLVDRIFTRIGASDNLARGRSTFMVEMTEAATILNTATARSLVLLDEIGRGTSTYDGLAIAWACIEHLHSRTGAKTLFATHYHELTELADRLSGVQNYRVSVKETGGNVVFLRKVEPGAADRSYGIEVAKLAGLPHDVIVRAREVLAEHEQAEQAVTAHLEADSAGDAAHVQLTMFTPLSQKVIDRLRDADVNRLTPLEALNLLSELKKQIE